MKHLRLAGLFLLCGVGVAVAADPVIDSVNASTTPPSNTVWGMSDVGWYYTPGFDYSLTGVDTKFGGPDSIPTNPPDPNRPIPPRTVTLIISDTNTPGDGGSILRSASFDVKIGASDADFNVFIGPTFAGLNLLAGHTYFVGFENVYGLPIDITKDAGATDLSPLRSDQYVVTGQFSLTGDPQYDYLRKPLLQFHGTASVIPEPATAALVGLSVVGLTGLLRRRR